MTSSPLVSIVINNYNYGRYLKGCIECALGQSYPNREVIVVDDGSTDHSVQLLEDFGDQITAVVQANGGQAAAYNAGFAASAGELLLFLDADDLLHPTLLEQVVAAWESGSAKMHYGLRMITAEGEALDGWHPNFLHRGNVVPIIEQFGMYASAPGSGNVYCRRALDKLLPMPEGPWRIAADSYLIVLVPFFGPVQTLDSENTGYYRLAGGAVSEGGVLNSSAQNPARAVAISSAARGAIAQALNDLELRKLDDFPKLPPADARLRLISYKVDRARHPFPGDGLWTLGLLAARSLLSWPGYAPTARWAYILWMFCLILSPPPLARKLIRWSTQPASRPAWVRSAMARLRNT
jgi:hypothetical protein